MSSPTQHSNTTPSADPATSASPAAALRSPAPNSSKTDGRSHEASPLSPETVMVITELALVGHKYLKALLLGGKLEALDTDADKAAAAKKHYQTLVETAGPAALEAFNRLCQFLYEQSFCGDKGTKTTSFSQPSGK